ncbi:hypothetical protein NDU88_001525 [Pleurodeles waltl]|uniref:Uncharacterized protein n=1 Tax=Pleurodeles waltl TaxID=8319 RepID=A0AAV7KYU8_PLEWA|nr:hypothetical protein NDU88_001525 [Pleurodeles waltl]
MYSRMRSMSRKRSKTPKPHTKKVMKKSQKKKYKAKKLSKKVPTNAPCCLLRKVSPEAENDEAQESSFSEVLQKVKRHLGDNQVFDAPQLSTS